MDKIRVGGGRKLAGNIYVSGSKNSSLPLYAAALLTGDDLVLNNVPDLNDMKSMQQLLESLGAKVSIKGSSSANGSIERTITINSGDINNFEASYELVRKMRASVLVLGPLLARFKRARVSLPGGCAIGTRPIDLHIFALQKMGAQITIEEGYVVASAEEGLVGADITFEKVSVGATENAMMAATLAKGMTILRNVAMEPEIIDLAQCLIKMGAIIRGYGTSTIVIEGVDQLHGTNHQVIGDRIEAGTFAVAAVITGGALNVHNINPSFLAAHLDVLEQAGAVVLPHENGFEIIAAKELRAVNVKTAPYPEFPTDLQAQLMALMTIANGSSRISENIFENRFMHAPELSRLGADIIVNDNNAIVNGVKVLKGAEVMATDLRASVCLVLAGLVAQGETIINRVYHLDRGYEHLETKLGNCNADIERIA
jgi:UDP-N-acetylglucosamine 1-carboxyvinyltransferase